jgi:alpha-D-ribose 1-methylphosphonate 5-triphosphate synthase subunit PhnG
LGHSEIIAEADAQGVKAVAEAVLNRLPVKILKAPAPGMVMVRHVDPLERTPYLLGEAYATECEVEVDGVIGYGCCLGTEEERALCGALVDAVMAGTHPFRDILLQLLAEEQRRISARREMEEKAVAGTRVDFETR